MVLGAGAQAHDGPLLHLLPPPTGGRGGRRALRGSRSSSTLSPVRKAGPLPSYAAFPKVLCFCRGTFRRRMSASQGRGRRRISMPFRTCGVVGFRVALAAVWADNLDAVLEAEPEIVIIGGAIGEPAIREGSRHGSRPIAQSGAWLAVGREIEKALARVGARGFQRFVDCSETKAAAGSSDGQGRSGLVAEMAAMRSMHIGRVAIRLARRPPLPFGAAMAFEVSGSGKTRSASTFAELAKEEGAERSKSLSTREPDNRLAKLAHRAGSTRRSKRRSSPQQPVEQQRASSSSTPSS